MSIQSALNSMLSTAGYLGGIARGISYQKETAAAAQSTAAEAKKQTKMQENWFGAKPTPDKNIGELLDAESGVQEAKDNIAQRQYQASGQEGRDMEDMAAYEQQAREKAIINYTRDTRTEAKQNHKEKRKEYLKKPRKLNRHGVLYEEVMK